MRRARPVQGPRTESRASPLARALEREARPIAASRLPSVEGRVAVLEWRSGAFRFAFAERAGDDVRVGGVEVLDSVPGPAVLRGLLARRAAPVPVVLVTEEARLEVLHAGESPVCAQQIPGGTARGWAVEAGPDTSEGRLLLASMPSRVRDRWARLVDEAGGRLEGIYPLAGTPVAGLALEHPERPCLLVQLEADWFAVIEAQNSSCRGLELHEGAPTPERCGEVIGEGCDEVHLCGGGVELPVLGYDLVRNGRVWVRLPRPSNGGGELPRECAGVVGAARHALGLAPVDAVACIPPSGA